MIGFPGSSTVLCATDEELKEQPRNIKTHTHYFLYMEIPCEKFKLYIEKNDPENTLLWPLWAEHVR